MMFLLGFVTGILFTVVSVGFWMMYEDRLDSDEGTGGWGV